MPQNHAKQQLLSVGTRAPPPFPANTTRSMKMPVIFHIWTPDHLTLVLWLYTKMLKTVWTVQIYHHFRTIFCKNHHFSSFVPKTVITRPFPTKFTTTTGFFYRSIIPGPFLTRSIVSTVSFKKPIITGPFSARSTILAVSLQKQTLQDHSSPKSIHQHCSPQNSHYRTITCKNLHPAISLHKNSYYRTIFHQKLHYRTILSTFQYHQMGITQNNITSVHQAPNSSSHLEDLTFTANTSIVTSTTPSRTIIQLQSEPLKIRYSKTIQHNQQQTVNTTTANPTIPLHPSSVP